MSLRRISVVLFPDVELLDVAGPVTLLARVEGLDIQLVSRDGAPVRSSQGVALAAHGDFAEMDGDVLLVPGGMGTRALVHDAEFLSELARMARTADIVASVCTGSALLAAAGLLEGYSATSNKRAFDWASSFGTDINWRRSARWVHDRDRWTSSGVAAGMDMAAALVAHYFGEATAQEITDAIELRVSRDPEDDPFAV